jgi:hypothetical protein
MKRVLQFAKIVGIILLILLVVGLVVAGIFGQLLNVLYIALIFLAFFSLLSTAFLIYATVMLIQTIQVVRDEMRPLMLSVQETVGVAKETVEAVKETAHHAGQTAGTLASTARLTRDYAVAPTVRAAALMLAGRDMVRVFAGKGRARTRVEDRQRRQEQLLREAELAETTSGGL